MLRRRRHGRAAGFHLPRIGTGDLGVGQVRSTNAAGSSAAASTWTIQQALPVPFFETASSAATWCACAWNSNNRLCRSVGTRGTDAAKPAKAAGTATSTGRMRSTTGDGRGTQDNGLCHPRAPHARRRYKVRPARNSHLLHDFLVEADAWRASVGDDPHTQRPALSSSLSVSFASCRYCRPTGVEAKTSPWAARSNQAMADTGCTDAPCCAWVICRCSGRSTSHDTSSRIEEVSVGGESGNEARPAITTGVFDLPQCVAADHPLRFPPAGARLVKDGRLCIRRPYQHSQPARPGSTTRQSDEVSYPPCRPLGIRPLFSHPLPASSQGHSRASFGRYGSACGKPPHFSPQSPRESPCPTPRPIPGIAFPVSCLSIAPTFRNSFSQ